MEPLLVNFLKHKLILCTLCHFNVVLSKVSLSFKFPSCSYFPVKVRRSFLNPLSPSGTQQWLILSSLHLSRNCWHGSCLTSSQKLWFISLLLHCKHRAFSIWTVLHEMSGGFNRGWCVMFITLKPINLLLNHAFTPNVHCCWDLMQGNKS